MAQLPPKDARQPLVTVRRLQADVQTALHKAASALFTYRGAGTRAPREVQKAIERFRRLPLAVRAQTPLWAWLLGDGTPAFKFTKAEVYYGAPPADRQAQRCANCVHAYQHVTSGVFICDMMRGQIAAEAWCNRWQPAMSTAAYIAYQER